MTGDLSLHTIMTEAKMEDIAQRAAERAVEAMFTRIGLDVNDPIKLQTDFATIRLLMRDEDAIEDMIFLRRFRQQMQGFSTKVGWAVLAMIITAVGTMLALGFRTWSGLFPPPH